MRDWRRSLPVDAPNHFMINIRPDEGAGVEQFYAAGEQDEAQDTNGSE